MKWNSLRRGGFAAPRNRAGDVQPEPHGRFGRHGAQKARRSPERPNVPAPGRCTFVRQRWGRSRTGDRSAYAWTWGDAPGATAVGGAEGLASGCWPATWSQRLSAEDSGLGDPYAQANAVAGRADSGAAQPSHSDQSCQALLGIGGERADNEDAVEAPAVRHPLRKDCGAAGVARCRP